MIQTKILISGVEFSDYKFLNFTQSTSENSLVSNYEVEYDNPYGRHATDFRVGNDIKIWAQRAVPYSYWKFNEGTGSISINQLRNDPIILVSGTRWMSGLKTFLGSGIYCGSPFFMVASGTDPANLDKMAISFWYAPQLYGGNNRILNQEDSASSNGFVILEGGASTEVQFRVRSGTSAVTLSFGSLFASSSNPANLIAYIDNTTRTARTYTNGSLRGESTNAFMGNVSAGQRFVIGKNSTSNANYFSGLIDDLHIFDTIPQQSDINQMLSRESSPKLRGIIDTITFRGEGLDETVLLRGRDYTARLMDNVVDTSVYTNTEVGSIVRDIIANNLTDIGSKNINTTITSLPRIAFNQVPIYDALTDLADLSNHFFYIDGDKDLHFEPIGDVAGGLTLDSSNIAKTLFDNTREGMANKIWVRGDRYFSAAPREVITSVSPGSVYTLTYNPHNSKIQTSNRTPGSNLKGGVFNMVHPNSLSGTDYLVNFFDRQIIFVSGTSIGYSTIPNAGGSIVAEYDRELPIVKYGEDNLSIQLYGPKTKIIDDKSIKDPLTAQNILDSELQKSNPLNNIQINFKGWEDIIAGTTADLNIPDFNLNINSIPIIEVSYDFTPDKAIEENVIKLNLDNRQIDITDQIKDLRRRTELLQAEDRQVGDVFTRAAYATGSILIVGSTWTISARWLGSEFRAWPSTNIPPVGSGGTPRLGILGSSTAIGAGSLSYLVATGFAFNPAQIMASGGYHY